MLDKPILTDKTEFPTDDVLERTLGGESYATFVALRNMLTEKYGLELNWHWYIDGGWLCKVLRKGKNLCWISPWEGLFRVTFYFMERHIEPFMELNVAEKLKTDLATAKRAGKLIGLIIEMRNDTYLADTEHILEFKMKIK